MSNRYISQNRNENKNSTKTLKKYLPKRDFRGPNAHKTSLSNSLRSADGEAGVFGAGNGDAVPTSRVRIGENGEWVSKACANGNFVIYLPQDEAVAAGLGYDEGGLDPVESQHVVDLLNRELSRLLKLRPKEFWREVSADESLHAFLESFLKFRNRWYDFPYRGAQGKVAGVIVGEFELCRRVFLVLYRLSSNGDPGGKAADTLIPRDHTALLQSKKLLDLPALLDICAIYGHENEDLTRILVMNAMNAQPHILDDISVLMSHFSSIVQTMNQRCSSTLEVLLSSGDYNEQASSHLLSDYLEVMDFINDAVVSMDSFTDAYKHAAVLFSSVVQMSDEAEELFTTLARLHDSLLTTLQRGLHHIYVIEENRKQEISQDMLSNVFASLKLLSMRLVNFGWKLLCLCYLSDEAFRSNYSSALVKMFPANVEDPVIRADIIMHLLKNLGREYANNTEGLSQMTFIQKIEKNHKLMSRIESLQKFGWIAMGDEEVWFLRGIIEPPTVVKNSSSVPMTSTRMQTDENAAIIESKISQIKELFPDYGRGFLTACLEAYNENAEEVIQRILEGTLHEELQSLDISLEKIPSPVTAASVSRHDKGKGKVVNSASPLSETAVPTAVKSEAGGSSNSSAVSVGRFIRKNTDDLSGFGILDAKKDKEITKTAALSAQLEYEDEYDDSFDDLGMSVGDSRLEESETVDKMNAQGGRLTEGDASGSTSNTDNSKWGSRKKPLFYVKDGKNYSYKVDGSVAVANYNEAKLVNQVQKELIHGLGRGGNIPLGSVKMLEELNEEHSDAPVADEVQGRGGRGSARGRGRKGSHLVGTKKQLEPNQEQTDAQHTNEVRGRGGQGVARGGGRNHHRQDRAMRKFLTGLPGHYN